MFVFIIDNKMTSRAAISSLDISKYAIESFLSSLLSIDQSLLPQLMLLQTGQSHNCLLSSFGDPISVFEQHLKNIDYVEGPPELTTLDYSYPISYALSVANTYRMKNGVDTYGHGRAPWQVTYTSYQQLEHSIDKCADVQDSQYRLIYLCFGLFVSANKKATDLTRASAIVTFI